MTRIENKYVRRESNLIGKTIESNQIENRDSKRVETVTSKTDDTDDGEHGGRSDGQARNVAV